jgi:hypothetical protein
MACGIKRQLQIAAGEQHRMQVLCELVPYRFRLI